MLESYGLSTLVVAVAVGLVTLLAAWRHAFATMGALLLLLLFHEFARRWLSSSLGFSDELVNALSRWWVVVILVLLLVVVVRWLQAWRNTRTIPSFHKTDILLALIVALGLVYAITSPNRTAGVAAFRSYFQPLGVYVLARAIWPTKRELQGFLILWIAVGVILTAFELWQFSSWTESDYLMRGYVRPGGELGVPGVTLGSVRRLRPPSTVTGPNELGIHMVLLSLMTLLWAYAARGVSRWILGACALLFFVGLTVTYSRSALIAFGVGLLALAGQAALGGGWRSWNDKVPRSMLSLGLAGVAVMTIAAWLLASGLAGRVVDTIATLPERYHYRDIVGAIAYLSQNPQGVGMGLVGPREGIFFQSVEEAFHVEGSLFQIAMEMGVWSLVIWLIFLGAVLVSIAHNRLSLKYRILHIVAGTAVAGWLGALVAFLILPLMQSIALMSWLWFLLGYGLSAHLIEQAWVRDRESVSVQPGPQ